VTLQSPPLPSHGDRMEETCRRLQTRIRPCPVGKSKRAITEEIVFKRPVASEPSGTAVAAVIEETLRAPVFVSTEALGKLDLLPKSPTSNLLVIPAVQISASGIGASSTGIS